MKDAKNLDLSAYYKRYKMRAPKFITFANMRKVWKDEASQKISCASTSSQRFELR